MKKVTIIPYFLVAVLLILTTDLSAQNREIQFEKGSWEEVLKKAQKENKPVFVDAYAVWCGPCQVMSRNTFTNDTVADFYNEKFINVKMDMEKGEGIDLAKKWEIKAYPTLIYFTPEGELMHQTLGGRNAAEFVTLGEDALNPEKQLGTFIKKYEAGNREPAFLAEYLVLLSGAYMDGAAVAKEYFSTQKEEELSSEQNWNVIYATVDDIDSREFKYLEKNRTVFENLYGKTNVEQKMEGVYAELLYQALYTGDEKAYAASKKKLLSRKNSTAKKAVLGVELRVAGRKKDWKAYTKIAEEYIRSYGGENYNLLNEVSWTMYKNITDKKQLNKALGWAEQSVRINENVYNLDTYAHLLDALGKKEEAVKHEERAIAIAKQTNDPILEELEANLKKFKGN